MVLRHRRDVEAIAEEMKVNRRLSREANRPTGTEINLTADTVAGMATDVEEAKEQAQQAIEDAANALTASNGKNSRRRGKTEPSPPPGGWVAGDQWVVDNADDQPVEVRVWNGTAFVHEQVLASELLILSGGGVVRLADGTVTADAIAADAIDGMIITGALIRTAATGMRLELTPDGLEAFNAADAKVATLFASSGGLAIDGTMQARAGDATYERTADMRGEQMTVGTFRVGADYVSTVGMIPGIGTPGIAAHIFPDTATGTHHKDAALSADSSGAHVRLRRYLPDDSDYSSLVMQLLNDKSARIWSTDGPLLVLAQEGPITLRSETHGVIVDGPTEFQGLVRFENDTDWEDLRPILSLSGAWVNSGPGWRIRRRDGMILLRGVVTNSTAYTSFSSFGGKLPAHYRPDATIGFTANSNASTVRKAIQIEADGTFSVYASAAGSAAWYLDGIQYAAA